ncbi:hypothetical protein GCM10010498_40960 [Streptomyces cavourensis]|nr:hypothetical protein GCM10010498_40960 [Streptomyces cavourensis]
MRRHAGGTGGAPLAYLVLVRPPCRSYGPWRAAARPGRAAGPEDGRIRTYGRVAAVAGRRQMRVTEETGIMPTGS